MTNKEKKELLDVNFDLIAHRMIDATDQLDEALHRLYTQVTQVEGANTISIKTLFDRCKEDMMLTQLQTICDLTHALSTGKEA